jgi:uncharacterized protein (TIGR03792 family)
MAKSVEPSLAKTYIEILEFQFAPADRDDFIAIDQAVWNPGLARCPAFTSKEVWLHPLRPDLVTLAIYWSDRAVWKAIPAAELQDLTNEFDRHFARPYALIGEREYLSLVR